MLYIERGTHNVDDASLRPIENMILKKPAPDLIRGGTVSGQDHAQNLGGVLAVLARRRTVPGRREICRRQRALRGAVGRGLFSGHLAEVVL
jgi:hypothetical protein